MGLYRLVSEVREYLSTLVEGKALPIGTKRVWKGGTFVKTTTGWKRLKGVKKAKANKIAAPKKLKSKIRPKVKAIKAKIGKVPPKATTQPLPKDTGFKLAKMPLDEFEARRQEYTKGLTPQESAACQYYSSSGYMSINDELRSSQGKLKGAHGEQVKQLDAAIAKHPAPRTFLVERGTEGIDYFSKMDVGSTYVDHGYSSTAATEGFDTQVQLHIEVPKGYPAAPIPSNHPVENEVLLPRGTKFKVTGKRMATRTVFGKQAKVLHLDVEVVMA